MWRIIRISILLLILATVVQQTFLDKADLDWKDNFYVAVYPVNADGSGEVTDYIKTLTRDDFEPMAEYFAEEGARYNLGMRRPVEVQLGGIVSEIPPAPPSDGSILGTVIWSLKGFGVRPEAGGMQSAEFTHNDQSDATTKEQRSNWKDK